MCPWRKKAFRDIRIEIINQSGDLIPFSDSQTPLKVVLHFRRVITPSYIYDIDTPPTYIYKYDAIRTVLHTPSRWWARQ